MQTTPKSLRLQIGIFGRVNVGKSSFLNMVAGQDVAITSSVPGTTTDVVEKTMELLPLGPVVFLDTAGLDDTSMLGDLRIERTMKALDRADVALLLVEPNVWGEAEENTVSLLRERKKPFILIINKEDTEPVSESFLAKTKASANTVLSVSSARREKRDEYVNALKSALIRLCPEDFLSSSSLLSDLVPSGGLVMMIVPIDIEAPKGRLILPQVQAIRDVLDSHQAGVLVVKESEYVLFLKKLKEPPALVICDSQVVDRMVKDTPPGVKCTTFSILFARFKGDLTELARGAAQIRHLKPGDRVLVAESCSHHAMEDDIGRVKIPRWFKEYVGGELKIDHCVGRDYPKNLESYKLVIYCGSCMLTRGEMLFRIHQARERGVAVTNYGLAIAFVHGVLERVLEPFPAVLDVFQKARDGR